MKFNQYTWNLYKQSSDGQKAIKEFEEANEKILNTNCFLNTILIQHVFFQKTIL